MLDTDVHIIAGPAAAACLQNGLALSRDHILIHYDLLSCGPLPALDSLENWRDVRESYLRSLDLEGASLPFAEQDRDVLMNQERLQSAETITLWLGTGLAEQLMLMWVVALLHRLRADAGKCRVVQFNLDRSHEVVAVGVLDPLRFKEHPRPTKLAESAIHMAVTAWEAVTSPEPDALLTLLAHRERPLPFLQRALSSLLYHYPDRSTGLNAWEYQLLRYVRDEGPKASRAIGYTMAHDMDFPEWMADSYLFQRLHRLADAALSRPLLTLSGDTKRLRGTEVRLTQHGEMILAGKGNAVEWNGIDDWVGGVHLDSRSGDVWYHREHTLVRGA
jgi:hypothetical protein